MPEARDFWLASAVAALGFGGLFMCGGDSDKAAKVPVQVAAKDDASLAKASGAPVIGYSVMRLGGKPAGVELIFVVPERRPNDQDLIDLAFDLRAKYPSAFFEIVDSADSAKRIAASDSTDEPVPDEFVTKHEFAMLNWMLDPNDPNGFRWKLMHDDRVIASFRNSASDIADVQKRRARVEAEARRTVAERRKCKEIQNKAISDLSLNDLKQVDQCKADGNW